MKKHNVLVVGGAGFIGSYVCSKLVNKGHFVVAIDDLSRGRKSNLSSLENNPSFLFYKMDVCNTKKLINVIRKNKIDFIFHLAANSDILVSSDDPGIEFKNTASSTWSILSAMRLTDVKNLFFSSTSAVYGELHDSKFLESDSLKPISYYGGAKLASEAFIQSFSYMNNFNALIFRFPNVIGPNLTHGVIYDFITKLKDNPSQLIVLGDGSQTKPYLHVDDLYKAIDMLVWDNAGVNIYNIGSESSTSVSMIANLVISEMGIKNCQIKYGKEKYGWKGDVNRFAYSLDKIHKIGWTASMSSDEAVLLSIKETLQK